MIVRRILKVLLPGIPLYYITAVLFGAPFFSHFVATLAFSIVLSLESLVPLAIAFENLIQFVDVILYSLAPNLREFVALRISFGSIVGAWLGACVIPLDWDRWWQRWPLPCVFGATAGSIIGFSFAFIEWLARKRRIRGLFRKKKGKIV